MAKDVKSRILITGVRAPSALDLLRKFNKAGYSVDIGDSFDFPISRFSNQYCRFHRLPSPRFEFDRFSQRIQQLQKEYNYLIILPTCEEIFYLAQVKELLNIDSIFTFDSQSLRELHDKFKITEKCLTWNIQTPQSYLLRSYQEFQSLNLNSKDFVFKPRFSRFASEVFISPTKELVEKLNWQIEWVMQKKVAGQEYCVYGVAQKGKLLAFCCYKPVCRVGTGAGILLEHVENQSILNFAKDFCEKEKFHGQFAFDIIGDPISKKFYLLECNPRATSGVHFFTEALISSFIPNQNLNEIVLPSNVSNKMIASAMIAYGFPRSFNQESWRKFKRDYRSANDVIFSNEDRNPTRFQLIPYIAMSLAGLFKKMNVEKISTEDIEFNG